MWKWTGSGSSARLPVFLISRLMASVVNGVRRSVVEHVAVVGERLAQRRQHPQLISGEHWPCRPWPAGHAARPVAQTPPAPIPTRRPPWRAGRDGRPQGSGWRPDGPQRPPSPKCHDDWEFAGPDDAKAVIRTAVEYLLRDATGGARGDIVQEIIAIVRQVASGLPPEQPDPLDDGLPGG
jgi:hypothetical protein